MDAELVSRLNPGRTFPVHVVKLESPLLLGLVHTHKQYESGVFTCQLDFTEDTIEHLLDLVYNQHESLDLVLKTANVKHLLEFIDFLNIPYLVDIILDKLYVISDDFTKFMNGYLESYVDSQSKLTEYLIALLPNAHIHGGKWAMVVNKLVKVALKDLYDNESIMVKSEWKDLPFDVLTRFWHCLTSNAQQHAYPSLESKRIFWNIPETPSSQRIHWVGRFVGFEHDPTNTRFQCLHTFDWGTCFLCTRKTRDNKLRLKLEFDTIDNDITAHIDLDFVLKSVSGGEKRKHVESLFCTLTTESMLEIMDIPSGFELSIVGTITLYLEQIKT